MCDFHSICVRTDGAIAHLPTNSHSGAVEAAKWRENQPNRDPFFLEVEGVDSTPKIRGGNPNETQKKAIDRHYGALEAVLKDPKKNILMLSGAGLFSGPEYLDVRVKAAGVTGCPFLSGIAMNMINRFGEAAYAPIEGMVAAISECSSDPKMVKRRIFLFTDWQIRRVIPEIFEILNCKDESRRLRAINEVTDSATAEIARREVESVRDILWRKYRARALARDLDRDLARDLARDLDLDRALARALALAFDLALDRDLDLARALARDRALALAFDLALDRDLDLARSRLLAMYLEFIERASVDAELPVPKG